MKKLLVVVAVALLFTPVAYAEQALQAGAEPVAQETAQVAEKYFLRAYNIVTERYDRAGVLERLIDIYKEIGMPEKAETYEKEYNDIMKS